MQRFKKQETHKAEKKEGQNEATGKLLFIALNNVKPIYPVCKQRHIVYSTHPSVTIRIQLDTQSISHGFKTEKVQTKCNGPPSKIDYIWLITRYL